MRTRTKAEILRTMTQAQMADEILRLDRVIRGEEFQVSVHKAPLFAAPTGHPLDADSDPMYADAVGIVKKFGKPSISLVQRHLKIGYNRAARLLERMEKEQLVSPMDSHGVRSLLEGGAQ